MSIKESWVYRGVTVHEVCFLSQYRKNTWEINLSNSPLEISWNFCDFNFSNNSPFWKHLNFEVYDKTESSFFYIFDQINF